MLQNIKCQVFGHLEKKEVSNLPQALDTYNKLATRAVRCLVQFIFHLGHALPGKICLFIFVQSDIICIRFYYIQRQTVQEQQR